MISVSPRLEECPTDASSLPFLLAGTRPDDLTTPVGAFLALAQDRPDAFLLESVEGGSWRGRYSAIGFDPDFIWTVVDGLALCGPSDTELEADGDDLITSLRRALAAAHMDLPPGVPPIASGLFGYIGYDMVRAVENLPGNAADPLNLPQAKLIRPRVVAVFDALRQDVTVYAPVRQEDGSLDAACVCGSAHSGRVCSARCAPVARRANVRA